MQNVDLRSISVCSSDFPSDRYARIDQQCRHFSNFLLKQIVALTVSVDLFLSTLARAAECLIVARCNVRWCCRCVVSLCFDGINFF